MQWSRQSQMPAPTLSDEAIKVLRVVRERNTDGYTIMSKTGLDAKQLEVAVLSLLQAGLISIEGEPFEKKIGEAYLWVPLDAKGYADLILGPLRRR